ncbi:CRISPR-associated helicase Cas3' [Actinokineospora pegani]|uniref:CRISPR-associated helicase Cas3' n=1 Tax=Actinokineospora pegani TaxID=2654637 RepID=UPI0012EAF340|nr:CRISPR-associated helicase Cas3' [Actinokineospora pegani]
MSSDESDWCLWAHSGNHAGAWHGLEEHLRGVAERAEGFGEVFGAGVLAWWLGLLHDVGKATDEWQRGLATVASTGASVGVDHKAAGMRWGVGLGLWRWVMAVHGHHGGLTSPVELHRFLSSPERDRAAEAEAVRRLTGLMPEFRSAARPTWPEGTREDPLAGEMLLRMVFSALVDADYLDTAAHFRVPDEVVESMSVGMKVLLDRFECGRAEELVDRKPSPVDDVRKRVYEASVAAAGTEQGFFRLSAPTGSGKTYAMAGFALRHAVRHGLRRVVVVVPFLSVTDQNAKVYRDLLDPECTGQVVLEHHSAIDVEAVRRRTVRGRRERSGRWQRLAAENWDAEFIVTTTVQLFESLHDRKPSRMRKLHRLANSVIVLDEVQAIPLHVLEPVLLMLRQLVEHFGVTVLLASATQPEFWDLPVLEGVEPVDVIDDPAELYTRLRRVRYRWWNQGRPTLAEVAVQAAEQRQALVVVNTTDHAREVHRHWRLMQDRGEISTAVVLRHLSTRMCLRHRLDIIKNIRQLQKDRADVLVASTQLIEAGVDLDFPVLYRAMAPAEALLQAAGRCNREGHLGVEGGLVVIFDPREQGRPPSYEVPLHETRLRFGPRRAEPDDLTALARYFPALYSSLGAEALGRAVVAARRDWDFTRTADLFRMIDDHSVPVFVDYTPVEDPGIRAKADRVIETLRRGRPVGPERMRHLQPFLASLPRKTADRMPETLLTPLIGDLYQWHGPYDPHIGIDPTYDPTTDPSMED